LGHCLFVICGEATGRTQINSIEFLDTRLLDSGTAEWFLFSISPEDMQPRWNPAIATISDHQIVIFGGISKIGNAIV